MSDLDILAFRAVNPRRLHPSDWHEFDLTNAGWCSCGTPDPMDHIDSCTVKLPADIIEEVEELLA